jgi:predicted nucleic acid-binding Zn ribbon protein
MPVYRYSCSCGNKDFEQYLKEDKDTKILKCVNCSKGILARQIRDKSVTFKEKDQVIGIMRSDNATGKR